ncbi:MAG: CHAT domain-containing tetratricopeptide repeat protein [Bacteroidota bacterium]
MKTRPHLLMVGICCYTASCLASLSPPKDSLEASDYLDRGYSHEMLDSAILYLQSGLEFYEEKRERVMWVKAVGRLGARFYYAGKITKAHQLLASSLAKTWWPADPLTAKLLMYQGYYHLHSGDYLEAKNRYEKIRQIYRHHEVEWKIAYNAFRSLAHIYTRLGAYQEARELLEVSIPILLDANKYDFAADVYSDLGVVVRYLEGPKAALRVYGEGLQTPEISTKSQSLLLANQAEAFKEVGDLAAAEHNTFQALSLINGMGLHEYEIGCHAVLGNVFTRKEQYQIANTHLDEALSISLKYYGTRFRREVGKLQLAKARIFLEQGQLDSCLTWAQHAIQSVVPNYSPQSLTDIPDVDELYPENTLMESLDLIAVVGRKQFEATADLKLLEKIRATTVLSLEVAELLRSTYSLEGSHLKLQADSHQQFERALWATWKLYESTTSPQYLGYAFDLIEKSRAVRLKSQLKDLHARTHAGIPEALLAAEQKFALEKGYLVKKTYELRQEIAKVGEDERDELLHELAEMQRRTASLRHQSDSIISLLETGFPKYHELKYAVQPLTWQEVQDQLAQRGENMLLYFWGEEHLFCLSTTDAGGQLTVIPNADSLKGQLAQFSHQLRMPSATNGKAERAAFSNFVQGAYGWYTQLKLEEILKHTTRERLVVIPDGGLAYLPFEVLLTSQVQPPHTVDYSPLPYLMKNHRVYYEYAAGFLVQQPDPPAAKHRFLAFAPSYTTSKETTALSVLDADLFANQFSPLAGSMERSQQLADLMQGSSLPGNHATEAQLKASIEEFQMLHFAMHGFINENAPLYSGLVCQPETTSFPDDGILYAYELYQMNLSAELAVLAACNTGNGQMAQGEGVMSLARAFRYAGCPSVVATLWPVQNASSGQIMQHFYEGISNGLAKDQALQAAQEAFLAENPYAPPYEWAGMVLTGNPEAIGKEKYPLEIAFWILALMGGCLGAFVALRRRNA